MKLFFRIARFAHYLLLAFSLAGAVAITFTRLWLPGVDAYKHRLEATIGKVLEGQVTIDHLSASIRGFSPELVLNGVSLLDGEKSDDDSQLAATEIRLGINLPEAVRHFQFTPSWITIVGAKFGVYLDQQGAVQIEGLKAGESSASPDWLFGEGHFELLDSEVDWQDRKNDGPLVRLSKVDVTLRNQHGRHQLMVEALLPKRSGSSLTMIAHFRGNIFKPNCCNGEIYFETGGLRLTDFLTMSLGDNLQLVSGLGSFQLWSEWKKSSLTDLFGRVDLKHVALQRGHDESTRVTLPRFASWLNLQQDGEFWQVSTNQTEISIEQGKPWPESKYHVRGKFSDSTDEQQLQLAATFFDMADLWPAATKLGQLNPDWLQWLKSAQPEGQVHDLHLYYQHVPEQPDKVTICGLFDQLNWQSSDQIPGIGDFSFHICGNDRFGKLVISSENTPLNIPQLPREPLWIKHLEGVFDWERLQDGSLSVATRDMLIATADLISRSRLRVVMQPEGGAPYLDAQTYFRDMDPTRIGAYLPVNDMPEGGVDWLDHAFRKGNIRTAQAVFRGNLADFPFAGREGVFQAIANLEDTELLYNADWPVIKNLSAKAYFRNKGLYVRVLDGDMGGSRVEKGDIYIRNFSTSDYLQASGQVYGSVRNSLGFMQQSPLHELIDDFLEYIEPKGHDRISVDMNVPIGADVFDLSVDGKIKLLNAGFKVTDLKLDVDNINGEVTFDEDNIHAPSLKAEVLDSPAILDFETRDGDILFDVDGEISAQALAGQFPGRIWKTLEGRTDYQVHLQIPRAANRTIFKTTLDISSELEGMAVNLPHPLSKTASSTSPFRVKMSLARGQKMPLNFSYGDHAQAILQFSEPGGETMKLESGAVVLGRGKLQLDGKPGVSLLARLDEFHLDEWRSFLNREKELSESPPDGILRNAHVIVDDFYLGERSLGKFMMGLQKNNNIWTGQVHNEFAHGRIEAPGSLRDISFDFDYLKIPEWDDELDTAADESNTIIDSESGPDPSSMPTIQITSDEVLWRDQNLGKLEIASSRDSTGIQIDKIQLDSELLHIDAHGSWLDEAGGEPHSMMSGTISTSDMGNALEKLQITTDIKETPAKLDFDLKWPGAVYAGGPENINGTVDIDLGVGHLLAVEPGIGRALGVINLGTWQRRLRLDFSDLYGKGMAYDQIAGKFELADGQASTRNFLLDAVAAKVLFSGRADMLKQELDFIVSVTPYSSASLPIAGAIAGGPIVGAAILLAQQLIGDEVDSVTSMHYSVTGSWADPQLTELDEKNGILLKAWDGLTDFPWSKKNTNE